MPLLDVILGYDCNVACDYCTITLEMRARALDTGAVVAQLRRGRDDGYERVSFTGGEPTIRRDLLPLVREAKRLGYEDIKVQSNGLLFAQRANLDRLLDAGANRIHLSIHTHDASAYDALVRREGSYPSMVAGLDNVVASGVAHTVDVILKRDTFEKLPDAMRWLSARCVTRVHLWLVSLTDNNRDNVASLPRMTDVVPFMIEAFRFGEENGVDVRSLHVPRCLLGEAANVAHAFDPGAEDVRVVTPEATFELRHSKITGQVHVPSCEGCAFRAICPGVRPDYLDVYGDAEIARARGAEPTIAGHRVVRVLPSSS